MDKAQLDRTILDAGRIIMGLGRSGRGRFVEATYDLSEELKLYREMIPPRIAVAIERWHAKDTPILSPQSIVDLSHSGRRPDSEVLGKTVTQLQDCDREGRNVLRWLGRDPKVGPGGYHYGKPPLRIYVEAAQVSLNNGECTLETL